jgi:putative GTP pyrophosphokinase
MSTSAADQYRELYPRYDKFCIKLRQLLDDLLRAHEIPVHAIEARPKSVTSFAEKVQRDGKSYQDPLREISDLAGARIILYYLDDVERVSQIIDQEFNVDSARSVDKASALAPDQLGYLSVHKVVSLGDTRRSLAEWSDLAGLVAELQIRTVLQHSWAAINHALQYKRAVEVPKESRRRLFRLSGLLELADEEFARLRRSEIALGEKIGTRIEQGDLAIPLSGLSVRKFLAQSKAAKAVIAAAKKAGLKVGADTEGRGRSQLIEVAELAGVTTVEGLRDLLEAIPRNLVHDVLVSLKAAFHSSQGSAAHYMAVALAANDASILETATRQNLWAKEYGAAVRKGRRASTSGQRAGRPAPST